MYEHEGKLLVRGIDGVLHSAYLTIAENGGPKVVLLEATFDSKPQGATPVTADAIVRRLHLEVGQRYPIAEVDTKVKDKKEEVKGTQSVPDQKAKIAAMAKKATATVAPKGDKK